MKHAIACLNTQIGILLHNASVFHGEGREEDRDRNIAEADDLRMAVEVLRDEIPTINDPGTDATQFRLLASFVGSKATSHTEIVSDTAAEIRALRTSLEAERRRTLEAERKCRELEFRDYRFLNVGEKLEFTDQYSPGDGTWHPVEDSEGTVGRDEEWKYRRPWKGYPGYRMLGADEKLCEGDEFHSASGRWIPAMERGNRVGRKHVGQYRRPISLDTKPENPDTPAA